MRCGRKKIPNLASVEQVVPAFFKSKAGYRYNSFLGAKPNVCHWPVKFDKINAQKTETFVFIQYVFLVLKWNATEYSPPIYTRRINCCGGKSSERMAQQAKLIQCRSPTLPSWNTVWVRAPFSYKTSNVLLGTLKLDSVTPQSEKVISEVSTL
jgi:hypothetical protein